VLLYHLTVPKSQPQRGGDTFIYQQIEAKLGPKQVLAQLAKEHGSK
jgi:hypothetical protein